MSDTKPIDAKGDCYSAGERAAMEWTQRVRGWLFAPLLKLLAGCRVTPDHLTLLSLAAGLSFCPLYFWSHAAAIGALAIHVLIDGLDGPLARHLGVDSRRGSFSDTMADQLVVAASTLTLMSADVVGVVAGGIYIFAYTVIVQMAIARNWLRIPYSWLVRPRFVVYAWIAVELYLLPGSIDYVVWSFNAILGVKMLSGFLMIRRTI